MDVPKCVIKIRIEAERRKTIYVLTISISVKICDPYECLQALGQIYQGHLLLIWDHCILNVVIVAFSYLFVCLFMCLFAKSDSTSRC